MNKIVQVTCLKEAAKNLGFNCIQYDRHGNFVGIHVKNKKLLFSNFTTPFNTGSAEAIAKDKEFTYNLLNRSVPMPRTVGYFDPEYRKEGYGKYVNKETIKEIVEDILEKFRFPLIVKRNSGSVGSNVFLCRNISEIHKSIETIFAKDNPDYDYVALAEDYIEFVNEYRVVFFQKQVVLAYEKDVRKAKYVGNLSPLHFEGAKAVLIHNEPLLKELSLFLEPVYDRFQINFAGADLLRDKNGKLWLLELNSRPVFSIFIRDNGKEPVVKMYEKMLNTFQ